MSAPGSTAFISLSGTLTRALTVATAFGGGAGSRLASAATALFDAGEQFTTTDLGGTAPYLELNNNGTYEDGTDYVINLGGGTANQSTLLLLVDAEFGAGVPRLQAGTVDIGAYEGAGAAGPIPEPAGLVLLALGLAGLTRRRS
jgi:MYXO-CTERM domain-containing protein